MSGPVVIKIGGRALEEQIHQDELWKVILLLHARDGVVLMHGGGAAVDAQLGRLGITSEKRDGIRITPREHLDQIVGVLAGVTNKMLVGAINRCGGRAVGLCLGDGRMATTNKSTRFSFDAGRVGEVSNTDPALLATLLREKFLPVVCSIGIDDKGEFLNINADDAATGLAQRIGASNLVLLTDVAGIKGPQGIEPELDRARIEEMIAQGSISGGMVVKARSAAATATQMGIPVVIISGESAAPLKALVAGEKVGTRILPR
jgi:acetylglutamate kinase